GEVEAREVAPDVDGVPKDGESFDGVVRVRVPGGRVSGRGREGSDVVPGLAADLGEVAPGVDRGAGDGEVKNLREEHAILRVRVPGGRVSGRGREGGDVVAGLAADLGEVAPGVDRGAGDGEGVDVPVSVRVPGGHGPARGVDSRDAVSGGTADLREVTASVDGRVGHDKRADRVVRVGVPGSRAAS